MRVLQLFCTSQIVVHEFTGVDIRLSEDQEAALSMGEKYLVIPSDPFTIAPT